MCASPPTNKHKMWNPRERVEDWRFLHLLWFSTANGLSCSFQQLNYCSGHSLVEQTKEEWCTVSIWHLTETKRILPRFVSIKTNQRIVRYKKTCRFKKDFWAAAKQAGCFISMCVSPIAFSATCPLVHVVEKAIGVTHIEMKHPACCTRAQKSFLNLQDFLYLITCTLFCSVHLFGKAM